MTVLVGGGAADVADVVDRVAAGLPADRPVHRRDDLPRPVPAPALGRPAGQGAGDEHAVDRRVSFGALVWIFQDGNLSALLGFQPLGFVETTQPVILFCVLFGLSMDYEVFLLSRMKEVWDRTGDNQEAVARGLERSGRIVTSAALIVVVVAGSFAFADIVLIKALGIGMAIAVALDATVVRALLVPATMRLLGHWNWWLPARACGGVPADRDGGDRRAARARPRRRAAARRLHGAARRSSPTRRRRIPPPPAATRRAVACRSTRSRSSCPRDDAPHDRLTEWWYYTGHLRAADGRRFGFEFVDLPGRARRLPGDLGVAPRAHRRDRPSRSATPSGPRSGRRSTVRRRATAFDLVDRADPREPAAPRRRRPGRCPAATAGITCGRVRDRPRRRPPAAAAGVGLDAGPPARTKPRRPPRRRRLDRLRRGRLVVLLLADARWPRPARSTVDGATLDGRRARPGSTTSGATSSRSAAAAGTGSRSTSPTGRT